MYCSEHPLEIKFSLHMKHVGLPQPDIEKEKQ